MAPAAFMASLLGEGQKASRMLLSPSIHQESSSVGVCKAVTHLPSALGALINCSLSNC